MPESPETAIQGTSTAAESSLNSTTEAEAADPPLTHAEQLKLTIEGIELGVAIEDSKVGDTNPLAEPNGSSSQAQEIDQIR